MCKCAPFPWCCLCYDSVPKLEVVKMGCICCCIEVDVSEEGGGPWGGPHAVRVAPGPVLLRAESDQL